MSLAASGDLAAADRAPVEAGIARVQDLLEAGDVAAAEAICLDLLARAPESAAALRLRGVCERQRGNLGQAAQTLHEAAQRDPGSALAQLDFGRTLFAMGRAPDAYAAFVRAAELDPELAAAQHNAGAALEQMARYAEAIPRYERSFALSGNVGSLVGCANCLLASGRPEDALDTYRRVLDIDPANADACANLGAMLMEHRAHLDALALFERALAVQPGHAAANRNHTTAFAALGAFVESMLADAASARPTVPDTGTQLGCVRALTLMSRCDDATRYLDAMVARQPQSLELRAARVGTMIAGGRTGRAAEAREEIARLKATSPDDGRLACWLGSLHDSLGTPAAARSAYAEALGTAHDGQARFQLGLLDLREGQLPAGWEGFEHRRDDDAAAWQRRHFAAPPWLGEEDIGHETLLVHAECWLGDTIQFSRYVPLARARARRVVLEVPASLHSIVRRCLGASAVTVARGALLPRFDRHCPLPSLPLVQHTSLETIPRTIPYLWADPVRVELWRDRLGPASAARVGIVWSGDPRHPRDWQRGIPLARLLEAIERAAQTSGERLEVIALQDECRAPDRDALANCASLRYFGKALGDFDDTAALIELCDLVIGIDAPAAHLAGAAGKPAWVLVPTAGDWRWLTGRSDSPWYPTLRLYRQREPGDWSEALAAVSAQLSLLLASRATGEARVEPGHAASP